MVCNSLSKLTQIIEARYLSMTALKIILKYIEGGNKMIERQWKLGEDMHKNDCVFDPITFEDIILALHCNERVIDRKAIQRVINEIMDSRAQDFDYLINNNIDEIIAEAKKGRE